MILFWFSKSQYFFNAIKCKSFKFFLRTFSLTDCLPRILLKKRNIWIVGVATILLPSLVYGLPYIGGQIASEDFKSSQMAVNVSELQEFAKVATIPKVTDIGIVSQESDFGEKGIFKLNSRFVKFSDMVKPKGISESNPSPNDGSKNCETSSNEYQFVGTKAQFWLSLLIGGLGGLIIGVGILKLIFIVFI